MNSSESAEEIVKMSLEGVEVAARITGKGVERLAVLLYTMAKDKRMTKGKTTLNNMLKSGSPLQIFSIKEDELKKFHEQSKQYGVLYTALFDKKHPSNDGYVDIMVRAEDAPKVNRIVEKFKLSTVDVASIKSEIEKDKIEEMEKDAKARGVKVKSFEEKLADDIMTKPIKKEEKEQSNPQVAKTEKDPLSEPLSESKSKSGVAINKKKPSVRDTLNRIKKEMKKKNSSKDEKSKDTSLKDKTTNEVKQEVVNPKKKKGKVR